MPESVRDCCRTSSRSGTEIPDFSVVKRASRPPNQTRRSGSWYGSGLSSTPRTMENTAVLAPMPRASVRSASNENEGCLHNSRAPKRRSSKSDPIRRLGLHTRQDSAHVGEALHHSGERTLEIDL